MTRKSLSIVLSRLGLGGRAAVPQRFVIGRTEVLPPPGWQLAKSDEEKLVFIAPDNHQQATLSVMRLPADMTILDFKVLCDKRIDFERAAMVDGFIEPDHPVPFGDRDTFGLLYFGGDRETHRAFGAYPSFVRGELLTIYVEGVDADPDELLKSNFTSFVKGIPSVNSRTSRRGSPSH